MPRLVVEQVKYSGLRNPVWEAPEDFTEGYLKRLSTLQPPPGPPLFCCKIPVDDAPNFIVLLIDQDRLVGRQLIQGDRVVSLLERDSTVKVLADPGRQLSMLLAPMAPANITQRTRTDISHSALRPVTWPNCECGVVPHAYHAWARLPELSKNNCYSFAVNCRLTDGDGGPLPGRLSSRMCDDPNWQPTTTQELIDGAIADGLHLLERGRRLPRLRRGFQYAAFLINPRVEADFHWMRLDSNRCWAHKIRGCPPHQCDDADRKVRFDSRRDDGGLSHHVPLGSYKFHRMFVVAPNTKVC